MAADGIIAELAIALGYEVDESGLDDAEKKARESAKKIQEAWSGVADKIASKLQGALVAITGAGAGITKLVTDATEAAERVAKLAARSETATREFQRLTFAFERSADLGADALADSLKSLDKALVEAGKGAGPAAESLRTLGLSASALVDLPTEAKLGAIADAMAALESPTTRTKVAMDLFGGSGDKIVPLLAEGSAGLRAYGDEAERLGVVLSDEAIAESERFNDTIDATKDRLLAAGKAIAIDLAPKVRQAIIDWESWGRVLVGLAGAIGALKLVQLPGQIGLAAGSMATLALRTAGATTAALALGVALGTALDTALGLSDAIAGVNQTKSRRVGNVALAEFTDDERAELATLQKRRETAERNSNFAGAADIRNAAQRQIDEINARARKRAEGRQALEGSRSRVTDTARRLVADRNISAAAKANERAQKRAQEIAAKKGGAKKEFTEDIGAGIFEADELFGDELRRLAERNGVGEAGVDAALQAAAGSLGEGAAQEVARQAALSRLGGLAGKDFTTKSKDPLLSAIFGDDVPDVELSSLAAGAEPQVLISTINNHFNFDNDFQISGAGEPRAVGDAVVLAQRDRFEGQIQQATRTVKVTFVR